MEREAVAGGLAGFVRDIEADGNMSERFEGQVHGIADEGCASVKKRAGFAAESEGAVGGGKNGRVLVMDGDVCGSD